MAGGTRAALRESQSCSCFFPKESQLDGNVEGHLEQRFRRLEPQAEDWGCKGERENWSWGCGEGTRPGSGQPGEGVAPQRPGLGAAEARLSWGARVWAP